MKDEENVADLIDARIPAQQLETALLVARAAERAGTEPYLVGGAVRDALLGRSPTGDLDISIVGADATTFDRIARNTGGRIAKSSQFNTARLEIDDRALDLAMARAETYPEPGSLPAVRPGTLAEDLARRDFTVNAMAVSLTSDRWGRLFDPHDGRDDLRGGLIRTLHDRSFQDDATRILRAARYSARLSFNLDDSTRQSLDRSIHFISTISAARLRNELGRIFIESSSASATLQMLYQWGALTAIHPDLVLDHAAWSQFEQECGSMPPDDRVGVGFAVLGAGLTVSDAEGVTVRLGLGSLNRRVLVESADLAIKLKAPNPAEMSNSQLVDMLDPYHRHAVTGCLLASTGEVCMRIGRYLSHLREMKPDLDGNDLVNMGVPHGPEVGRILRKLRTAKLDGAVHTRQDERALVLRLMETLTD